MPAHAYDYAILRAVPRVERGERINVGVVLSCPTRGFLDCATHLDRARLSALDPRADVEALARHLLSLEAVCRGQRNAGPIAALPRTERFHWLVSPKSTVLQASAVHAGRCEDPAGTLAHLFETLVLTGIGGRTKDPATVADVLAIPEPERFHEIIDGELVRKAMRSPRHGRSQARLTMRLGGPYDRRPGGDQPGGWRFLTETEVQLDDREVYRPDVAGWRRERLPELPEQSPLLVIPDWVCEILSPSNERNDVVKKMRAYKRARVPHYWLIDPIAETLIVYRWTEDGYLLVLDAQGEERVRAEPFEAVSFSVHGLLDGDDE